MTSIYRRLRSDSLGLAGGLIALVCVAGLCAPAAYGGNIVANGGFETGDLTSWTGGANWFVDVTAFGINGPHSGTDLAGSTCIGAPCVSTPTSFISQNLATVAAQTYSLTFWYDLGTCQGGCGAEELKVLWDGGTVFDLSTTTSASTDPGWTQATVNGLVASTSSTPLEFIGRHDPAALGLDDVVVDTSSAVPEPASMALLGSGLAALVVLRRTRLVRRSR